MSEIRDELSKHPVRTRVMLTLETDEDERTTVLDEWNRTGVDFPEACFHELFEHMLHVIKQLPTLFSHIRTFQLRR